MDKTFEFTVKVTIKDWTYVKKEEVRQHVRDAVNCWGGQLSPEDDLFSEYVHTTVKHVKEKRNVG